MNIQDLVDKPAPAFTLPDQDGKEHSLQEYQGKWLVVYFYPKDDTPGCTKEACAFRDTMPELRSAGIEVIGISKDSIKSHKKFAEKYQLPFTLLADETHQVIAEYGSWGKKKFMGREFEGTLRNTVLINPSGTVTKVYEKVKPQGHAREILADVATLS